MLYLYYTRCGEDLQLPDDGVFSEYRRNRLAAIKAPALKKQSKVAELLLNHAVCQFDANVKLPLDIPVTSGRPELRCGGLYFSISHSENIVACAVSEKNIGLDVQLERKYSPALVVRFFSKPEVDLYSSSTDKDDVFFRIWSMKESYVKATGKGISYGLNKFSVLQDGTGLFDGTSFWSERIDNCYFSLCAMQGADSKPDIFEYINIKELL